MTRHPPSTRRAWAGDERASYGWYPVREQFFHTSFWQPRRVVGYSLVHHEIPRRACVYACDRLPDPHALGRMHFESPISSWGNIANNSASYMA